MLERREGNSDNFLNLLVDATPNIIIITDGIKTLYANKSCVDFLEYTSFEAFVAEHDCICDFFENYAPDAILKQMGELNWFEYVLKHAKEKNCVYMSKNGKMHIFRLNVSEILFHEKQIYSAILNDITELEAQKESYEQAIEGAQIGLWDWNLETDELYFSPTWKAMLGFSDEEFPHTFDAWESRVHPDDLENALKAVDDNIKGLTPHYQCILRMRHKDGHWIWIDDRGKTFFDKNGKATRMVGIQNDITVVKESEAKNHLYARRSAALLEMPSLNETLSESAFMQRSLEIVEDLTHSIVSFIHFVNDDEKTIELVTWSHRTLENYCHAVYDTHYPSAQAGIWADALRQRKAIVVNDYPNFMDKKGLPQGHAPLHRFISLPIIEDGKVVMLCGIGNKALDYDDQDLETLQFIANETWRLVQRKRNALKLKEASELLLAQSRNAAMGEMINMIAHQWRQPISVIAMCANNMLLDIELEDINQEEFQKQTRDILSQTEHLSTTIDDFRNFFKPNKNKELVTIESVMQDAIKLMQKSFENNNIEIKLDLQSDTPIEIYSRELMQVVLNLLKNAKEALDQNPTIPRWISVHLEKTPEYLITTICDNGGGIKEENMHKIFEPYFSTKSEKNGTGLGLYMSKVIIEKHLLGKLSVSNKGEGACFEIKLPYK